MTDQPRSPRYIINRILRSHALHLLAGSSGSNKSTWMFQQLRDNWRAGGEILGYAVNPVPFLYISADRSLDEASETLERLGMDPATFPFFSLTSKFAREHKLRNWKNLFRLIRETKPEVRLLIIDGFMGIIPSRRDRNTDGGFSHIADFLTEFQGELEDADLTCIAICHATKTKEDNRYNNPRERILGSAAWAAHSSTIFVLEPTNAGDRASTDLRTMIVCPRNAPERHIDYRLNEQGWLIEYQEELDSVFIEEFLAKIGPGNTFTTAVFCDTLARYMSEPTAKRRLRKLFDDGRTVRVGKGVYKVTVPM